MPHTPPSSEVKDTEFVALMALLMSLLALSIDAILPALFQIGSSLGVDPDSPNENQLLLSTIFIGMATGLMIYGPLSDAYGRRKIIYLGVAIFICGTVISLVSTSFSMMLIGRVIQGFGAASCRVVTVAMIRDKFEGSEMAKVMSFITMVFIIVPAVAPSIGQGILLFAGWRTIFTFILVISLICVVWLHIRLPETLPHENRRGFSFIVIADAISETIKNPVSRGYTIASGLMFGGFVGYLSSAQQILQIQYDLGDKFSIVFGGLALTIGASSYVNSKLLKKFSMDRLCLFSLIGLSLASVIFYLHSLSEQPSLIELLVYLTVAFFNFGILFGNFNTLALNPLGHIAGTATSVIASIQTLLSVVIGGLIGFFYDDSILPLVLGFMLTAIGALSISLYFNFVYKETEIKTGLVIDEY